MLANRVVKAACPLDVGGGGGTVALTELAGGGGDVAEAAAVPAADPLVPPVPVCQTQEMSGTESTAQAQGCSRTARPGVTS